MKTEDRHPLLSQIINEKSEPYLHMCYTRYYPGNLVSGALLNEDLGPALVDLLTCGDMCYDRTTKLASVAWFPLIDVGTPQSVLDDLEGIFVKMNYKDFSDVIKSKYWDVVNYLGYYVLKNDWEVDRYDERLKDLNVILDKDDPVEYLKELGFIKKEVATQQLCVNGSDLTICKKVENGN